MANREDIALMAHLLRRAGFGASREEIERRWCVNEDVIKVGFGLLEQGSQSSLTLNEGNKFDLSACQISVGGE